MNTPKEIYEKLKTSKKVLLSLHIAPDGDSLGSCAAFKYFLERDLDCEVKIISKDLISENFSKLEIAKDIDFGKDVTNINLKEYDVFVYLDTSDPERISKDPEIKEYMKKIFTINIDHHKTNESCADYNYIIDDFPSNCGVLIKFFKELDVKFDKKLSSYLIFGVYTDSNHLRSGENVKAALEDVVFLLNNGADYYEDVLKKITYNIPLKYKIFFAKLILNLKIDSEKNVGYSILSKEELKELNLNEAEIRLGINELTDINEIDVVFVLIEMENIIKGSFRSKKIDVSEFAKELGGGGHKNRSAFYLDCSLQEAKEKVLKLIYEKM